MIDLNDVTKIYKLRNGEEKIIAKNLTIQLPHRNIGVLGRNGMGKSTLLRMLAGIEKPDSGEIKRKCPVSWPIGFRGSFHRELSGIENVRFIARIYGQDTEAITDFVEDFAELGSFYKEPVKNYSSGMVARLAFGASMAVEFGCYLIDEVMAVGDAKFRAKSDRVFQGKLSNSNLIMVSHSMGDLKKYCDCAVLVHNGKWIFYEDVPEAIEEYNRLNKL